MIIRKTSHFNWVLHISACLLIAVLFACLWLISAQSENVYAEEPEVIWGRYQNSLENNGITDRETPDTYRNSFIRWGKKMSDSMYGADSFTPPIIIGDVLYTASKNKVYAIDKKTGETLRASGTMAGVADYAMNPLEYDADHRQLYVPITKGRVVCLKADENASDDKDKLKILWTSKTYDNAQAVTPVVYRDGYVYTGTYTGPGTDGIYFCLDCNTGETKWEFKPSLNEGFPSGFYWAGAYVSPSNYMVFGSDDGFTSALDGGGSETAALHSVSKTSGVLLDAIRNCKGSIKSSVVYHYGYVYWVTKGGVLYKVKMNANGTFDKSTLASVSMPDDGMMTSAPAIYNRRIYVGVAGTGGQFTADGGHMLAVVDDKKLTSLNSNALIYTTQIRGYAQAAPVLSTAYEQATGKVKAYFTYNAPPGGIYYLDDSASSTAASHSEAELLFEPEKEMQEYCISTIAVDSDGTLYIKNDSGHLMAVEKNEAYLNSINVSVGDVKLLDQNSFDVSRRDYKLKAPDDAEQISFELDVPSGMAAKINGESYPGSGTVRISMPDASLTVPVEVRKGTQTRTYNITLARKSNNANLVDVQLTDSGVPVKLSNEFNPDQTSIITEEIPAPDVSMFEDGTPFNSFVSLKVTPEDPDTVVQVKPCQFVGTACDSEGNIEMKGGAYPIYWTLGQPSMTVMVRVISASGKTVKDYYVTILRTDEAVEFGRKNRYTEDNDPIRLKDKDPLLLSDYSVDLYTQGAGQTHEMKAYLGNVDVTDYSTCQWESTDDSIVTVEKNNGKVFLHSNDKEGEAVIWVEYGKLRVHVSVSVTKPTAEKPVANIRSGRYTEDQILTLESSSEGAQIRYNIGDENVKAPESTTGTVYSGPISLSGEDGCITTYYVKAIATNEGFFNSSLATYKYVIDKRTQIHGVELDNIAKPQPGEPLSDTVTVSADAVDATSVTWYEVGEDGDTKVTGNAEEGKLYKAVIGLQASLPDSYCFADDLLVTADGRTADVEHNEDDFAAVNASLYYSLDPAKVVLIPIGGFPGGQKYDGRIAVAADGITCDCITVNDKDGSDVTDDPLSYNTEYTFVVTLEIADDADFDENVSVVLRHKGESKDCTIDKVSDTVYKASFEATTYKLKVDTSSGSGLTASPQVLSGIPNGSSEEFIRSKFDEVTVSVKTVDGQTTVIDRGSVYWDTENMDYDINSVAAAEFGVFGTVTLPDYMDANGSSRMVKVTVKVSRGSVKAPKASLASGTYTAAKQVSLTSDTPGAAIRYSINGGTEKTYNTALSLKGAAGETYVYEITAYALKNGVKSDTLKLKYTIKLPDKNAAKIAAAKKLKVSGLAVKCKSRKFTVTWKKNKKATGYQVWYKLKTATKWRKLKSTTVLKAVSKRLKKGKKYQFRVKTYTKIAGKQYYGKWTSVKTVRCK